MEDAARIQELKEKFAGGKLNTEELKNLDQELASNPALAEEFELHRIAVAGVRSYGDQVLKEELKQIHQQEMQPTASIRPIRKILSLAAAILVLAAASFWLLSQPKSNEKLFSEFYEPYEISISSRDTDSDKQLAMAAELYQNKNYGEAIAILNDLLTEQPEEGQLILAAGISQLELSDYQMAAKHFEQLMARDDTFLNDMATWYAGLTYLKWGKTAKAMDLLQILAEDEKADKHKEAKILLEKLN